ncbi:MAG: hypothetical protein HRT88_22680, partial [Lentisphaeraceae bacterium]|nr:hypothetical protein [Lentisphaeraceae bacterium]
LVSIENSKHNIDKTTFKGPAISGDTKNKGDGGDAIWKNTLLPEEQELLKRYFK